MNVSYNWLKDYLDLNLGAEEVEKILNSIGLEVEHSEVIEEIPGGLEGVVTAEVLECEPHPNSDHLHVTKVNIGEAEPLQIVCGAPNVAKGQKVLLATLNTKLTFSNGEEVKIKKSKIRGVESFGMICAEDELGLGAGHDGIMVLPQDTPVGIPAKVYLNLKTDTLFEIGLTPNRVDAASHIGVARDLSAYLKLNNMGGEMKMPSVAAFEKEVGTTKEGAVTVEVKGVAGVTRYAGLTIKGVEVKESPEWLKKRLQAVGLRSIDNVVDITNFILMELGQPLHSFDADKIAGNHVIVDFCKEGTPFTTLDGVERKLSDKDLMICNGNHEPMCLAGVFGGKESGVTAQTKNIFLESACFNPIFIRKSSKRHGLKTDASFRYERGVDPELAIYALKRAALLIKEVAGGEILDNIVDIIPVPIERRVVELNYERMENLIGKKIGKETIKRILGYLEMETIAETAEGCTVKVPCYRVDVYRECDIVEDVLRIYGYNNVELPDEMRVSINTTPNPDPERVKVLTSEFLSANGFMEVMNNSLTKADYYSHLKTFPRENCVMILNPLSSDLNAMRQTLLMGGLEVIAYNINRQTSDLKLYEFGHVYSYHAGEEHLNAYKEEPKLALFVTGNGYKGWRNSTVCGHFFSLKGYLELLLKRYGINLTQLEYGIAPADIYSEGLTYILPGGKVIATMGTVSPARLRQFGIKQPVFAAEIDWNLLLKAVKKIKVQYKELPKYPEVSRDLALLVDMDVTYADMIKCAYATEKKLLKRVNLFDVYVGEKIPKGKKQYAINFVLQDEEKTLNDKTVDAIMDKLLKAFGAKFGATLR